MIWALTSLSGYLLILEILHGTCFILIPLGFLAFALWMYFRDKTRLINGFLFNCFILIFGIYLAFSVYVTQDLISLGLLGIALVAAILIALFGFISLLIFLYWNALVVLRKERRSLPNLLTLLLAIFLTGILIYNHFIAQNLPLWLSTLLSGLPVIMFYFAVAFLNFLTVSLLYQFNHPRYRQDYIIALGAGLIDGERVTPLLARRIDTAISFYRRQLTKTQKQAQLLMSGGQGPDEKISEAQAMKNYALSQGIPEDAILLEDRSTNTLENMRFSKPSWNSTVPRGIKRFLRPTITIFSGGDVRPGSGVKSRWFRCEDGFYLLA